MSGELSLTRLDRDGALVDAAERVDRLTRAGFLGALGGSALALGAWPGRARAAAVNVADRAILNYALVLEYLQAAFYTEAERQGAINGHTARAAAVVGGVERAHVKAFRDLLGRDAVKAPSFDFQGMTEEQKAFLKTAVAFEDLAVAAYKGRRPACARTRCWRRRWRSTRSRRGTPPGCAACPLASPGPPRCRPPTVTAEAARAR